VVAVLHDVAFLVVWISTQHLAALRVVLPLRIIRWRLSSTFSNACGVSHHLDTGLLFIAGVAAWLFMNYPGAKDV